MQFEDQVPPTPFQRLKAALPTQFQAHIPIILIVILSTLINLILVFKGSDYSTYLTSDMHGYWERAQQIYNGDEMDPNTWVSNAPFYPRVIAVIFTWLGYFHLNAWFLEALLTINILLSALGTLALYGIGLHVLNSRRAAWLLAGAYAFSYPRLYFNAFLLGEPFAVPLILCALWLMYRYRDGYKVYLSGLILAFAVGVRPSNGLLAAPIALYIAFAGSTLKWSERRQWLTTLWPKFWRAALFSAAFLAVTFTIVAENNRISRGQLRGMTAHSGYNFFLGQAQSHKIISSYDGITYIFVPSSVAGHPEYGTVTTDIPIYASDRFFEEGKKLLASSPGLYWDHLKDYNQLFFDNLFPAVPSVAGFNTWFDPFRYIQFYMLLLCGLGYIALRERDIRTADVALFSSVFVLCSASLFFFTITHQYFLNFSYSVYVLFAIALTSVLRHHSRYKRFILAYVLLTLGAVAIYYPLKALSKTWFDKKIEILIEQNEDPILNFEQTKKVLSRETLAVDKLQFFESEGLEHGTLGNLKYSDTFYMTARTEMEVLEAGTYMFTFYADDGYEVTIDGNKILGHNGLKKMDEFSLRTTIPLAAGRHLVQIRYFENYVLSGLVGYYRRIDPNTPPASRYEYDTRRGQGQLIGDDTPLTRFRLPPQTGK